MVVSAMGHTTDELIELAQQVSAKPPHREMDMLLTAGERISMALLSMALSDRGVPAISLTGSQTGIITDGSHRRARIRRILGDRVRKALAEEKVVIVAGFQGVSEEREITTLGRGGSDTTAVALAAALGAEACEIYTDVDGVYSADPRLIPQARFYPRLSLDLMVELATRGAGVLHPRSVELARQSGIRLRVLNSLREHEGTTLVGRNEMSEMKGDRGQERGQERGMEEFSVVGVTADRGRMLLSVELERATVISSVWDRAAESHLSILSPIFVGTVVQAFVERDAEDDWKRVLERLAVEGFIRKYELDSGKVPVSIIGDRFCQDGTALSKVLEILGRDHISVAMGVASALAITVAVPENRAEDAVRALHSEFVEGSASGR